MIIIKFNYILHIHRIIYKAFLKYFLILSVFKTVTEGKKKKKSLYATFLLIQTN